MNDNNSLYQSHQDDDLNRFISNYMRRNKKVPLDNIYVFTTKDKNGNIIDTKFGTNVICKSGFKDYIPLKYAYYLEIGDGDSIPTYNDEGLSHKLGDAISGTTISNTYTPVQFDQSSGLIIQREARGLYIIDYTYLDRTFDITEFGIRNAINGNYFITHGRILDNEGNPSHITKELYNKLEVTLYFLYAVHKDVFARMRDRGVYGIFPIVLTKYSGNISTTYSLYDEAHSIDRSTGSLRSDVNLSTNALMKHSSSVKTPSWLVEDPHTYISGIGMQGTFFYIPLTTDEEDLVSDEVFCVSDESPSLNDMFQGISLKYQRSEGRYVFPVANFKIKSSYMYNMIDHAWNIPDQYTDCENSEFRTLWCLLNAPLYMNNPNGIPKYECIYENINMDSPIKKFDNSGKTIYATDEWWDVSTWILITNLNNMTREQGTKRYYIMEYNSSVPNGDRLYPIRDQNYPAFIWDKPFNLSDTVFDNSTTLPTVTFYGCISDEYEAVCTANYIVFHPEGMPGGFDTTTQAVTKDLRFRYDQSITGDTGTSKQINYNYRHIFDDKLVVYAGWFNSVGSSTSGSHIRIIDIGDPTINMNASAENPFIDVQIDFENKTRTNIQSVSFTWDGDYLIGYEGRAKEIVGVRIHGNVDSDVPEQMKIATNISSHTFDYCNNGVIYIKTEEPIILHYYDLENETDMEIDIRDYDDSVNSIVGYLGYNGIVYIRAKDNSNNIHLYFYNVNSDSWNSDFSIDCYGIKIDGMAACVDRAAILHGSNGSNKYLYLIDSANPYQFTELQVSSYNIMSGFEMKYMNNKKQLIFKFDGNRSALSGISFTIDIGRALDNPSDFYFYSGDKYISIYGILYKDYFISRRNFYFNLRPIANLIMHKMTITSDTISAYNNPFRIPETDMFRLVYSGKMNRALVDPCSTYPVDCNPESNYFVQIDMYESSTLAHRFVPCKRNSDQMLGIIDVVTSEFIEILEKDGCVYLEGSSTIDTVTIPAGYTQLSHIISPEPNWFSTVRMQHPILHTANTKIIWYGYLKGAKLPPKQSDYTDYDPYSACLFGSIDGETSNEHQFLFRVKVVNDGVIECEYRRGSATSYKTNISFSADPEVFGDFTVVCDGFNCDIYKSHNISGSPTATITVTDGVLDNGVTPMAFWTLGSPNGVDYTNQNS